MTEEERKEKINKQQDEQYLAIGKFVVNYEHLLDAIKFKLKQICGNGEEIKILIEAFPAIQTIEILSNLIEWKIKEINESQESKKLFKRLIEDLKTLNTKRNFFVHTIWLIGWTNKDSTDVSEITGKKYLTEKKKIYKKLKTSEINDAIEDCKRFYQIMYTSWTIDKNDKHFKVPPFHELYSRNNKGKWESLR